MQFTPSKKLVNARLAVYETLSEADDSMLSLDDKDDNLVTVCEKTDDSSDDDDDDGQQHVGVTKPARVTSEPSLHSLIYSHPSANSHRHSLPPLSSPTLSAVSTAADSDYPPPSTRTDPSPLSLDLRVEQDRDAQHPQPAATTYRLTRQMPDGVEAVTPIAGAPALRPLAPGDALARDWAEHLQRRFLRRVGNAVLPTVVVCGHMCAADPDSDGPPYVYVLALRERVDERDPLWIGLCLDLEDEAQLWGGVAIDVVQTVGWIEGL